jgi:hypothetical protein
MLRWIQAYHGTTRNRCADRRSPRSRSTVGAEVNGSLSAKLCVLNDDCSVPGRPIIIDQLQKRSRPVYHEGCLSSLSSLCRWDGPWPLRTSSGLRSVPSARTVKMSSWQPALRRAMEHDPLAAGRPSRLEREERPRPVSRGICRSPLPSGRMTLGVCQRAMVIPGHAGRVALLDWSAVRLFRAGGGPGRAGAGTLRHRSRPCRLRRAGHVGPPPPYLSGSGDQVAKELGAHTGTGESATCWPCRGGGPGSVEAGPGSPPS